ncbi:MAG: ATP phosphoribosyltransferase [Gammaproteobacteria bacterium]|nr:ATP phosphoribosyltransferase [Gammaproteobacteria bacterium]
MRETAPRLRIAIQKSGRLTDNSLDLLTRCGLRFSRARDQLVCFGENLPLDILLVRDDDIPGLVQEDACELGIVGQNVIAEKRLALAGNGGAPFQEVMALDFGRCRLAIAVPEDAAWAGIESVRGRRVATSYPLVLARWLADRGISADVIPQNGAVEIAPRLGRADMICDLVSTGSTLAANGLREVETVLESRAALIRTPVSIAPEKADWLDRLLRRIEGVQKVDGSKYIMLHAPRAALARITALLPGSEHPTILPLDGTDEKVALHAVCRENVFWETLESLKGAGATSILVLPVEKMLA